MPGMLRSLCALAVGGSVICSAAMATRHTVSVGSNFFSPVNTTVNHGDTVRFVRSSGTHTSTSDPLSPKEWNSGALQAGVPFDVEITESDGPGPFPFHCDFHPTMKGTIFVQNLDVQLETVDQIPSAFRVEQNFPNPFNPTTTIGFALERTERVRFSVINIAGQVVESKDLGLLAAGAYTIEWSGISDAGKLLPSGVYFYRVQSGGVSETRKMLLMK